MQYSRLHRAAAAWTKVARQILAWYDKYLKEESASAK